MSVKIQSAEIDFNLISFPIKTLNWLGEESTKTPFVGVLTTDLGLALSFV